MTGIDKLIEASKRNAEELKNQRLGEKNINNQGFEMTIVEYNNSMDVIVEFQDGCRKKTSYNDFKNGVTLNPNYPKKRTMPLKEERMSEIIISKEGYPMHLVEYNRQKDVVVEFLDEYKARVHTDYRFFKQGGVRNPNKIGEIGERVGNASPTVEDGKEIKEFKTWRAIINRVKGLTEHSRRFYDDVKICDEWLYYTNYYNWVHTQENYDRWKANIDGVWAIDKDILSDPFNKIYSPNTCCLVPDYINSIVVRQRQKNRDFQLPLGIQYYKYGKGKYFYADKTSGKRINVYFDTIDEAVVGYKEFKNKTIRDAAEYAYKKGDITKRCYEGLLKYDYFAYENVNT